MIHKYTIKNILLSLIIMGIVSTVTLLVLGFFTYTLRWQASWAMLGITSAYILSGFAGGMLQGKLDGPLELRSRMVNGTILGTGYMIVLIILSLIFVKGGNWDIARLVMIWILLVSSSILGGILTNIICKKH